MSDSGTDFEVDPAIRDRLALALDVDDLVRGDVGDGDCENLGVHRARLRSVPAESLAREFARVRDGHDARLDVHLLHLGGYRGDDALLIHGQRECARVLTLVRAALEQLGRYHPLRLARDERGGEVTFDVELQAVALGGGVDGLVVVPELVVSLQDGRCVQTRARRLKDRAVHRRHLGRPMRHFSLASSAKSVEFLSRGSSAARCERRVEVSRTTCALESRVGLSCVARADSSARTIHWPGPTPRRSPN